MLPVQEVSPQLLLNTISVNEGEYAVAEKNSQQNVQTAINEIIGQLGNLIVIREQEGKDEVVLALQIALRLCKMDKTDDALDELGNLVEILRKEASASPIQKMGYSGQMTPQHPLTSLQSMKPAYVFLADRCFAYLEASDRSERIRQDFYQLLERVTD